MLQLSKVTEFMWDSASELIRVEVPARVSMKERENIMDIESDIK